MTVKRYDPINSDGTCGICLEDPDYGAYVEFADYDALQSLNAELLEALDLMVSTHEDGGWPTATITIARAAIAKARQA